MNKIKALFSFLVKLGLIGVLLAALGATGIYYYLKPDLPNVQQLREIRLQTPLRLYSEDGKLISEFGEKRRSPIQFDAIPATFVNALLAAEDNRFYQHIGVDFKGLARAAFQLISTGRIQTGGSTITMQVAKNYFLTRARTFTRKFSEILLALQIEQEMSKNEIFELYVNKIYLGHRAYGIQAAANVYYGRDINQLTTAELAMIAGLPKAPSANNPLSNPSRAKTRRDWILSRMLELGYIDQPHYDEQVASPLTATFHGTDIELTAPYVAEIARAELLERFGERIYTDGFTATVTINSAAQEAANLAVTEGLLAYDRRHGYRGPYGTLPLESDLELLRAKIADQPAVGVLQPALVLSLEEQSAMLLTREGEELTLPWTGLSWASTYIDENTKGPKPERADQILKPGDLIYLYTATEGPLLAQIPEAQAALTALSPRDGAIKAMVGGFNFNQSKYNRATQATRQPGSNFKPFIYSAALANGFTTATLINDAPVVFEDSNLESSWRPENYSRKFYGPTRFREALYKSRNLVSIRILRSIGIKTGREYAHQFGFPLERLPDNLSLSLGTAAVTPLELVTGYATFANEGYKITPYLLRQVESIEEGVLFEATPHTICEDCLYVAAPAEVPADNTLTVTRNPIAPRIMDSQTAYLIHNVMQDVIQRGTGRKAKALGRNDLAGKTGTTNEQKDAWFSGYNADVVASVWVGFDQPKSLGRREFGSTAALPIWIDFMRTALADLPERPRIPPQGIVSVKIDPESGRLAYPGQKEAIFELFRRSDVPKEQAESPLRTTTTKASTEDLF